MILNNLLKKTVNSTQAATARLPWSVGASQTLLNYLSRVFPVFWHYAKVTMNDAPDVRVCPNGTIRYYG